MVHDKMSFAREYCRCRRIPYRVNGEQLLIAGKSVCFSIYNEEYWEIVDMIDDAVWYNQTTGFFESARCA